jgi:hypothetical protein
MCAMRAPALPETDADRIAPATWTVPAQVARREPEPGQPASAGAASDRVVRGQLGPSAPARMRTASSGAGRAEAARNRTRDDLAARGTTAGGTVTRSALTLGIPAGGQTVRGQAAAAPLRLTKRGRIVVAAAAALLVSLLSLLASEAAHATSHSAPPRVADRNLMQVVVQHGQSLWSLAQSADRSADPRQVMQQIIELNGLTSDMIFTGERLWVPRG